MKKKHLLIATLIGSMLLLSACGGSGDPGKAGPDTQKNKDPYTMTLYAAGVSPEEFNARWRSTLEAKFSHITFNYRTNEKGASIAELVAQGDIPDLIRTDIPTLKTNYIDLGLAYDLRDLVKKYNYDLKRFNNTFVQEIVDLVRTGELYGLPVPPFFPMVLYYNKDLFDKFGVSYPKDGMTMDEVYEIAKRMTRVDGDTIYRGFSANTMSMLRDNPFSHPILDPELDQLSSTDVWVKMFNNFKRFYEIPNNTIGTTTSLENQAFSTGNVAMQANQHNIYLVIPPEINWDMVAYPLIDGSPKYMGQRGPAYWAITNQSKHKEDGFEVIMTMLSDEIQEQDSRNGIPTTLVNKNIQSVLGKDHPVYSTKNMNAINMYPPTPPTPKRKADLVDVAGGTTQNLMASTFHDMVINNKDVNTALRELSEKLKKAVEDERSKQ